MHNWTWPAYVGIFGGLGFFLLFMIPIIAIQYRMYGRFTWRRFLGAGAMSVYGVALVAYTLLPPPERALLCGPGSSRNQWVPFGFLGDIQRETAGLPLLAALSSPVTLQVVFNVVLFIPWGIIVRRYFSRGVLVTTLSGFLASVLIEASQYTGLWGIYDCEYRLAEVDDVITNTAGALIGALIAPVVLGFMPQQREFFESRHQNRPVTVWRRWLGMAIDYAALSIMGALLLILYRLALQMTTREIPAAGDSLSNALPILMAGFLVFHLPAFYGRGASLGQRMIWLTPDWKDNTLWRRLVRASVVGGLYTVLTFLAGLYSTPIFGFLAWLVVLAAIVSVPLTGGRGLSCVAAGARIVDSREARRSGQGTQPAS
ncbi:VanZ family protein [Arthrobacter pigmenti]